MKLFLNLNPNNASDDNGIGRVVHAQHKYLPRYGIEITNDWKNADVVAVHIAARGGEKRVDVLHSHGLYFADLPHMSYVSWHSAVNHEIVDSSRKALKITVPSQWVAMPFKRDMRISPVVIGHGIDLTDARHDQPVNYALWNKNRVGDVCDPTPAWELAAKGIDIVSTFAVPNKPALDKLRVVGTMSHADMMVLVGSANIYLATTIETFGVGTLEAMMCGVPVLGYNWGGTADIVTHKVDGYLVAPGDIEGLAAGYEYIQAHRAEMSDRAREKAAQYDWSNIMAQYAKLYEGIAHELQNEKDTHGVSVVITNYNYSKWVMGAIDSALKQTQKPDEIIVVDDGSKDNSVQLIRERYGSNPLVKIITQANQGVAAARTTGIQAARYPLIICLDADDELAAGYVGLLSGAMEQDRSLGIAYAGLTLIDAKGKTLGSSQFPPEFSWDIQSSLTNPPANCIPSAAMFRKEMWRRAGWHKQKFAPGEDAEFWTRGLSVGFTARRVSTTPLFRYRLHDAGAHVTKPYRTIDEDLPWMRDRVYPMGAPLLRRPDAIYSYLFPLVSVVVPVGKGHARYLPEVIESVVAQSCREWELIIVDDTIEDDKSEITGDIMSPYPFARVVPNMGKHGAGIARNLGIDAAIAPTLMFLDCDDMLTNNALDVLLGALARSDDEISYVYSDYILRQKSGDSIERLKSYNRMDWKLQHAVTVLMYTECAQRMKFDETYESWEDWEYFVRCAVNGICGQHVPEPLMIYRIDTGHRRMLTLTKQGELSTRGKEILGRLSKQYSGYYKGVNKMMACSGCGSKAGKQIIAAKRVIASQQAPRVGGGGQPINVKRIENVNIEPAKVRMEYIGSAQGNMTFKVNGHTYRAGASQSGRYLDVLATDVADMEKLRVFRVIGARANPPVNTQATKTRNPEKAASQDELHAEAQARSESVKPRVSTVNETPVADKPFLDGFLGSKKRG